jgi:hypothetical protein
VTVVRRPPSRVSAALLAAAVALASCAHSGEANEPLVMTERVVREVCIPFVVDGIDHDEAARRLGGWWFRNPPDPFTPVLGGIFSQRGVNIRLDNGRSARTPDGALTTRPARSCNIWLGRGIDEMALVAAVRTAANRPAVQWAAPGQVDGYRRVIGCIPTGPDRIAVVNAMVYRDGRTGVSVYETGAGPRNCVG